MTGQLPTNRTTADTAATHVADHNELHRAHNRVFDVVGYGATGDGVTDDSSAIQSAITAAVNATFSGIGATVYFPSGKYYIATGLTCTVPGTAFLGEGMPGQNNSSTGSTQIIVGDGIWGLTLGSAGSGDYRGYRMDGLEFFEKNSGGALGGLRIIDSSQGYYTNCAFGRFTKSVSTTYTGSTVALSTLSTFTLTSATNFPTSGSGYCITNGGTGGQTYHSFRYTGKSGNNLTGVVFNNPTTDTITSGQSVVAAVGVGILVDGAPNSGIGEASNNSFHRCMVGICTMGFLQLGVSLTRMVDFFADGNNNNVASVTAGSCGIRLISGTLLATGGEIQAYDTCLHVCKANQETFTEFRYEGYSTTAIQLESDAGTNNAMIGGFASSNISGHGPGLTIASGVQNTIVTADINSLSPIADNGTGTRYPYQSGVPTRGPNVTGNVIGRVPYYDLTNTLIGYAPLYDTIGGLYLINKIGNGAGNDTTGVTSLARTVNVPVNVGDLILIAGGYGLVTSNSTVTITDSRSNTYTLDQHTNGGALGTTPHAFVASCVVTTALQVGDTITVSYSPGVNHPLNYYYDWRGQTAGTIKDVSAGATGTSTSPSSGNLVTTVAGDLIFGSIFFNQSTTLTTVGSTGGITFTAQDTSGDSSKRIWVGDASMSASGTYTFNGTLGASVDWAVAAVAYKKA